MNRKKMIGILISCCGVALARSDAVFGSMEPQVTFGFKAAGIMLALAGLCVFAAGIKTTVRKIAVCRMCGGVGDGTEAICAKCRDIRRSSGGAEP